MKGHERSHKLIIPTKRNKEITSNDTTYVYKENDNYRRRMCPSCIFFINENCSKKRVPIKCAQKGLKNKE